MDPVWTSGRPYFSDGLALSPTNITHEQEKTGGLTKNVPQTGLVMSYPQKQRDVHQRQHADMQDPK